MPTVRTHSIATTPDPGLISATRAGNGEYRLTYDAPSSAWTWTDIKNSLTETYDAAHGGRLTGTSDTYGNALTYTYDPASGLLQKVTTADGEYTQLNWSGTTNSPASRYMALVAPL